MRAGRYIVLITAFWVAACSQSRVPSNIIQPHEMGNMLFEISMAEEFVNSFMAKDSSRDKEVEIRKEYQKIFLLHNVTEAQFKESYGFYKAHPVIFKTMMDSLNARAQRARNELYRDIPD